MALSYDLLRRRPSDRPGPGDRPDAIRAELAEHSGAAC
jgi:hypothetical protein